MLSFRYQISRSELVRLHHENATARSEATQTRYAARIEEAQEQHGELVSHMLNQAAFQAASAPALYLC